MDKKLVVVVLGLLGLVAASFPLTEASPGGQPSARPNAKSLGTADPPNILIVMTDDQRLQGTLSALPETQARIGHQGVFFPRAVSNTPQCCPARATVMTGRYAHNHGVIDNFSAGKLDMSSTMQARLQAAGYHTAIFGKFLNHFPPKHPYLRGTVGKFFNRFPSHPPYFDRYFVYNRKPFYEDASFNDQGDMGVIDGYVTDLIATKAIEQLETLETTDDKPWYFLLAPRAPHGPQIPAQRHQDAAVPRLRKVPSMTEKDRSDKPRHVANKTVTVTRINRVARQQLRTLLAVDELVVRVDEALESLGERENTMVFFMSDNGYAWGDHGLLGTDVSKNHPYRASVSVPLMMRWPAMLESEGRSRRLVGLVDVAPTIYDAIGLPIRNLDGLSLLTEDFERRWQFAEHQDTEENPHVPTWASLRNDKVLFVEYFLDGNVEFREYYDLANDPWENDNLFHDGRPGNTPHAEKLHRLLLRMRRCEGRHGPNSCI